MNPIDNPSRAKILARITAALATPASPHARSTSDPAFAPVANPLERFQKECAGNNTECVMTPNLDASAIAISNILSALPAGEIFVQDSPELRRMASAWTRHDIRWSSGTADGVGSKSGPSESSQATITMAEALVAQTGSVLVSAECGGRGAAIVAPVHIVVAEAAQLVPDLEAAFAQVKERGTALRNSYLCFITGSSRTADIEKILVMGAHGPRRLVVTVALAAE
ncbi:MAG: LUD domain-containing protein [Candidatus Acidiferrales bacterium]